jgi:hypothetical protein
VAESRVDQFLAALPPHERGSVAGEVLRLYVGGLEAQLAAVRAVLAPLLDSPICEHACVFCGAADPARDNPWGPPPEVQHRPGCPVPRRDELLGRAAQGTR